MNKLILKSSISIGLALTLLIVSNNVQASSVHGTLNAGGSNTLTGNLGGGGIDGVLTSPPIATPGAGTYGSAQSVTLTASGATSIYYTTDGSNPTCSTGNLYAGAITVSSSEPIEAISCYPNNASSTVAVYLYGINPPNTNSGNGGSGDSGNVGTGSVSSGGGGSYSSGGSSGSSNKVGITDFVLLMSNWGQAGSGNAADFDHDSATIGIQDFIWLMANWNS